MKESVSASNVSKNLQWVDLEFNLGWLPLGVRAAGVSHISNLDKGYSSSPMISNPRSLIIGKIEKKTNTFVIVLLM